MRFEIRPHLIERLIDQIGHHERGRRRRNPDEQRHRRLRTDHSSFRWVCGEHSLLLRIDVAHISRLQVLLAEAQNGVDHPLAPTYRYSPDERSTTSFNPAPLSAFYATSWARCAGLPAYAFWRVARAVAD